MQQHIEFHASTGIPSASIQIKVVPPKPPKPPWHKRLMDTINRLRTVEWLWERVPPEVREAVKDFIGGSFRARHPTPV